jgi:hypothetical protein
VDAGVLVLDVLEAFFELEPQPAATVAATAMHTIAPETRLIP